MGPLTGGVEDPCDFDSRGDACLFLVELEGVDGPAIAFGGMGRADRVGRVGVISFCGLTGVSLTRVDFRAAEGGVGGTISGWGNGAEAVRRDLGHVDQQRHGQRGGR